MQLLETTEQSLEIEKIFKGSINFTIIVSPYLKIHNRLKSKLEVCYANNHQNIVLFRENQLTKDEWEHFSRFTNVLLLPIRNLHAKCYINDSEALISSMNLYEYSQVNNHEIGVKLTSREDKKEYEKLLVFIKNIIKTDYPEFDFRPFRFFQEIFTVKQLYDDLSNICHFPDTNHDRDSSYKYFCNLARQLHNFKPKELYEDKTAILRNAQLEHELYSKLRREIIDLKRKK